MIRGISTVVALTRIADVDQLIQAKSYPEEFHSYKIDKGIKCGSVFHTCLYPVSTRLAGNDDADTAACSRDIAQCRSGT